MQFSVPQEMTRYHRHTRMGRTTFTWSTTTCCCSRTDGQIALSTVTTRLILPPSTACKYCMRSAFVFAWCLPGWWYCSAHAGSPWGACLPAVTHQWADVHARNTSLELQLASTNMNGRCSLSLATHPNDSPVLHLPCPLCAWVLCSPASSVSQLSKPTTLRQASGSRGELISWSAPPAAAHQGPY